MSLALLMNIVMNLMIVILMNMARRRRTYRLERSKLGLVVKDVKPGVLVQASVTLII